MLKGAINRGVFLLLTLPSAGGFWTDFSKCSERGLKRIFNVFFLGALQQKGLQDQEFFGMGCLKIFWVKGKTALKG